MDLWSSHRPTDMTVEQAIGLLEAVDQVPGATLEVLELTLADGRVGAESDDPYFAAQGAVEVAYENLGLRPTKREPAGWLLTVASIAAAFAVWQLLFFPLADARVGGFWQTWFPLIVAGIVWVAVIAGISVISSRTWPH